MSDPARIWRNKSATAAVRLSQFDAGSPVRAVSFLRDGGVATASEDGLRVWDAGRGLEPKRAATRQYNAMHFFRDVPRTE